MREIEKKILLEKILEFLKREEESSREIAEEESQETFPNKADFYFGQASAYGTVYDMIKIKLTQIKF